MPSTNTGALPIPQVMEGALSLIGLACAALLVVDLHLDHLAELPHPEAPPTGDQARREALLGHAMARMAQPPPSSMAWVETQPMVAPGARADPVPSSWG